MDEGQQLATYLSMGVLSRQGCSAGVGLTTLVGTV